MTQRKTQNWATLVWLESTSHPKRCSAQYYMTLGNGQCKTQTADCGLQTKGKMKTRGKMKNEDYRLQTRGEMREKASGNMSALVEVRRNLFNIVKMFAIFFHVQIGKFVYLLRHSTVFPPKIVRNTLFIKEFCFNFKPQIAQNLIGLRKATRVISE